MNVIFQRARTQINIQEQYAGADVLKILMDIIKVHKFVLRQTRNQSRFSRIKIIAHFFALGPWAPIFSFKKNCGADSFPYSAFL